MPRKHERKPIFTEIVLRSASGKREARISDLSMGGCFVDTIVNAQVGEEVSLKITFDPGYVLELTGTIAYVLEGNGFGVSFTDLTDAAVKSLSQQLADLK
jgi:hypothetical protein